jgi:hypothetical protein
MHHTGRHNVRKGARIVSKSLMDLAIFPEQGMAALDVLGNEPPPTGRWMG